MSFILIFPIIIETHRLLEAEEKYSAKSTDSDDTIVQLRLEIAENTAAFKVHAHVYL